MEEGDKDGFDPTDSKLMMTPMDKPQVPRGFVEPEYELEKQD